MNKSDDCPNTSRMDDMLTRCRDQHGELNTLLREIRVELSAIRESIAERMKGHSQRIQVVERDVLMLREDADIQFDKLGKDLGQLNIRFWKMAGGVGLILITLQKTVPPLDWWTKLVTP